MSNSLFADDCRETWQYRQVCSQRSVTTKMWSPVESGRRRSRVRSLMASSSAGSRLAWHLDQVHRPQPCEQVLVGAGSLGHADELIRCDEDVLPHQVGEDHRIRIEPVEAHRQQLPAMRGQRRRPPLQFDRVDHASVPASASPSIRPVCENTSAKTRFRSGSVSLAIRTRRI